MPKLKITNNAVSRLSANISPTDTSISLLPGGGASFPSLAADEWFPATLVKVDGTLEIVHVIARATDVLTIVRGQESTAAISFNAGDRLDLRLTAGSLMGELGRIEDIAVGSSDSLRSDLAAETGGNLVGLDDGAGGTLWTTLVGFVSKVRSSIGSSLIGFVQSYVGAVIRSVQDVLRERVSVKDFGAVGDGVTDDTAAFIAAIAAADVIYIPPGTYLVGRIPINKNNFTMRGAGYNRSILLAKSTYEITIDVASTRSVTGLVLEDFKLQGNATAAGGLRLGSSTINYCAVAMLNRLSIWEYSRSVTTAGFGIQLACVQNIDITNCWIYRNRNGYQRLLGTGYATSIKIAGKGGYIGEGYVGVFIDGQIDDIYLDDNVIEGNNNSGIIITANAVSGNRGTNMYISGAYLEYNNATGLGVISVTGNVATYQEHVLVVDRCNFAVNTGARVSLDRTIATIKSCKINPAEVTTTVNTTVIFDGNRYPSAANYFATYRAMLGNIIVRDTNDPVTGTTPNQINMVNGLTYPVIARQVDDPYTLDDYREGIWNPELSSSGTPPVYSNLEPAEGTYTKIGDLVFCRCKLRVNISNVGTGTPRITGFPFQPKSGLEPATFGLATALATTASGYIVTGPYLVLGSAYQVTSGGYIVFTITYKAL